MKSRSAPRLVRAGLFSAAPLFSIGLFALMNFLRYGSPFVTGYHVVFAKDVFMEFRNIPRNLPHYGAWLLRTPWLILCIPALVSLGRKSRLFAATLLTAIAAQTLFWLLLPRSERRHDVSLSADDDCALFAGLSNSVAVHRKVAGSRIDLRCAGGRFVGTVWLHGRRRAAGGLQRLQRNVPFLHLLP